MSPEEGDKTTCYSLSADAAVRSPRMGRQLGCRPSLAAWRIAPESIFLKGFGAWSVSIKFFCCSWIILFRLLSASVSVSPLRSRQPSTFRLQALTCMFTVMTHSTRGTDTFSVLTLSVCLTFDTPEKHSPRPVLCRDTYTCIWYTHACKGRGLTAFFWLRLPHLSTCCDSSRVTCTVSLLENHGTSASQRPLTLLKLL